jgi:hypothetical protein
VEEVRSTALLLLKLYGDDVIFDSTAAVEEFLSGSDLIDKPLWRRLLLAVRDLRPVVVGGHFIH